MVEVEEKVEFRDEAGNVLDPEQVRKLQEQDVKFQTKYETRTKILDEAGNEVPAAGAGVHPPHPDVEGRNPNTARQEKGQGQAEREASASPPNVGADADVR